MNNIKLSVQKVSFFRCNKKQLLRKKCSYQQKLQVEPDKYDNTNSVESDDGENRNKTMLADFSRKVLEQFEIFYEEQQIDPFEDEYYHTYLTARVWSDFNKFALCLFNDKPQEERTELNIKVLEKDSQNYYVYPIQTIDFPYTSYNTTFGVDPLRLAWDDKQIFFKFLSDGLNISISVQNNKSESDTESDSDVIFYPKKLLLGR